ncbi:hypothetical protein HHI36_009469 [Cryptolaemus montrouzieri]|uniref:Sensory neuron membrane protein 1 n=1 Tax=Cryptolaemus montrouzieri TaxID=559131 RepID=A0ABD2MFP8_9CUCU
MSKNADEKCFCPTNDTCLKKGLMDLFKCIGVPIYVSLPHFYDSDESYLRTVKGLNPNKEKHSIEILFEHMTGGPVSARKRLQFNMPIEPNSKVTLFNDLPNAIHPIFWVEEGVSLNNTFTKPIKDLFRIMKIVKITKWLILVASLVGIVIAAYLMYKNTGNVDITTAVKIKPKDFESPISRINGDAKNGYVNSAMNNDSDKF